MDETALVVVVVFLAVAGWIRTIIRLPRFGPRVEGFRKLFQNFLTGLRVQSLVFRMTLQLVFEVAVVGNLARFFPLLSRVVVGDVVRLCLTGYQTQSDNVPEFAGRPSVPVDRVLYLSVVEDFCPVCSVDFQHSERLYKHLYSLLL